MNGPIPFKLQGDCDIGRLLGGLNAQYTIKKEPDKTETTTIYDTFDWRLFKKSLVLHRCGDKVCLRNLFQRDLLHCISIDSPPVFVWEFPDGRFKKQLAPILGVRALLKLAEVRSRLRPCGLLDSEGKTVVRLACEEIRSSSEENAPAPAVYLWLLPVKGYSRHARKIAEQFAAAGLAVGTEDAVYFEGLRMAGKEPGSYSSKMTVQLAPEMRADEATKAILRFLLQIIRVNEANIEKDIDTEFVHDFRVAVRRTRSALGQIRSVFPSRTTDRFKKEFASLGKLSNALRDLDVYLLREAAYKKKIVPVLRKDIDPLFDHLRKKRAEAFQEVVRGLKSGRYEKGIKDWETFLNKPVPSSPTAPNAGLPVITLARKRIITKYRRVVKTGKQVLEGGDDTMLHILRIHCKKLRYLMEFFAGLFPADKMDILISQLKRLQDNLGEINDLRVQEEYLLTVAGELSTERGQSRRTLLAIGSLVGTLAAERQSAKDAFAETFSDFASSSNEALFQDLFAPQVSGGEP
ncbi:MAG: CHAD domain-containing protein [Deltaproteobacteria bacterium]|nr:CHAD domain-containing protein [Deltaproteobacteria bacterium]